MKKLWILTVLFAFCLTGSMLVVACGDDDDDDDEDLLGGDDDDDSGNSTYEVFGVTSTWNSAKSDCEDLGGHLATITSQSESDTVVAEISAEISGWNNCLIGLSDRDQEGSFTWVTGESVDWTNWNAGEPNDQDSAEDCADTHPDGKWNDIGCDFDVDCYVCEYD